MGIYKKLGIRKKAIQLVELINWVRLFHLKKGIVIFCSLLKKKKEIGITIYNNKVILRNNVADIVIFKQVFFDEQYYLYNFPLSKVNRIIDAGANIGLASIYFTQYLNKPDIIAIEPESDNFVQLKKNTNPYPNIICENFAVWGNNSTVTMQNPHDNSSSFMFSEKQVLPNTQSIQAITINAILKKYEWDYVDIVKIDVEGAEKEIFSADDVANWISKTKLLIIELHDNFVSDCTKTFFSALQPFNYKAFFHHENIFIVLNHSR